MKLMDNCTQNKIEACKVTAYVSYSLTVTCPLCGQSLDLNAWPYDDEQEQYGPAEDEIGEALFGYKDIPAKWEGIDIPYTCHKCECSFSVCSIEI
jgi:hypothetical protein